jgi:hypothetical protein
MTKNPFVNAIAAIVYIIIVALIMFFGIEHSKPANTIIVPITVVSLFSLSAATMAYIFFYQPLQLYLDGKKKIATDLFLKTLAIFAAITAVLLILLLSGIVS